MADTTEKQSESNGERSTTRLGLLLFGVYAVIYTAFVLLNALAPATMDWMPIPGVNLAILYGFFLIFAALALALVYGWLCRSQTDG